VLQPVEWVARADGSRGLVAFSLGNLVSNQDFDNAAGLKRDSVLLELTFVKAAPGEATALTAVTGVAIATENRLGRGRERNVQPVVLDDEVSAIEARLEALGGRADADAKLEALALSKRLRLVRGRLERISSVLGPAAQ
jgi:poly-gamma-glutamate synthesis protein (capsule biosynthesis protein)